MLSDQKLIENKIVLARVKERHTGTHQETEDTRAQRTSETPSSAGALRSSKTLAQYTWKEATNAIKMSDITFVRDVRRMNPMWFIQQFKETIQGAQQAANNSKPKHCSKVFSEGQQQWARLLDTPTYIQMQTLFKEKYW